MRRCTGIVVVLTIAALMSGCHSIRRKMDAEKTPLTVGAHVAVSTSAPPPECKSLGIVSYSFFKGTFFACDFNDAQNSLRNQAAIKGGNYLKLLGINDAGVRCQGSGEAYECPSPPDPPAQ